MRNVHVNVITENIKEMCIEANHFLSPDMKCALDGAAVTEESPLGKQILGQLQENLAMWYNLNLTNSGEGKPTEGYESIWYLEEGLMCTVEFLKDGVTLPVWHGARNAQNLGFTHEQRSSLPVGGSGNHTVLYGKADVLDEIVFPQRGDRICVHALGSSLTYRIFDVKTTKRDPALPEFEQERDLCSIRIQTDNGWVMIRGVRVKESER